MESKKPLKLWLLEPKDPQEPPFHFHGVPMKIIVAADSKDMARTLAAHENGTDAWRDEAMSSCVEMQPKSVGVIARDMG